MGCYATPGTLKFYLLEEQFFLSINHKTATKSLKRGILEECLLSFFASYRIISRDGYRLVFIRYQYITDTFKTIPVPKRCRNRYFYKKYCLLTLKKGFFSLHA